MTKFWLLALGVIVIGIGACLWYLYQPKADGALKNFTSFKGEVLKVNIKENQKVASPLFITGEVKGTWSFEGSFPVTLTDENLTVLVEVPGTLQGDWMTTDYVPFEASVEFSNPPSKKGFLILKKDNPSDQRELDDEIKIPVRF